MTWTKIDYDDPSTLPKPSEPTFDKRVMFVLLRAGKEVFCCGWWSGERWLDEETDSYGRMDYHRGEVTHWQPLPALPEMK